jgi:hypothetical protein
MARPCRRPGPRGRADEGGEHLLTRMADSCARAARRTATAARPVALRRRVRLRVVSCRWSSRRRDVPRRVDAVQSTICQWRRPCGRHCPRSRRLRTAPRWMPGVPRASATDTTTSPPVASRRVVPSRRVPSRPQDMVAAASPTPGRVRKRRPKHDPAAGGPGSCGKEGAKRVRRSAACGRGAGRTRPRGVYVSRRGRCILCGLFALSATVQKRPAVENRRSDRSR